MENVMFAFVLISILLNLNLFEMTPLDDYVNKPDPHYQYSELYSRTGPGFTSYFLNMTSQKWKTENFTDQPIWWHYVTVNIPDQLVITDTAFLFIEGGSNTHGPPNTGSKYVYMTTMATVSSGAVTCDIKMVPNQPLVFKNDPNRKSRVEDEICSWTWKMFIEEDGEDPEVLIRMPMTKAAVRALDTCAEVAREKINASISKFVVAGASKRGWTTWMVAAVDKRVVAFAPIVMDLLNMIQNLHHHYKSYGGWSYKLHDYFLNNITRNLDKPATQLMADIIDPIAYNDRYRKIPKLIVSVTGDEFFLPDDSQMFYKQLSGAKYLRMIPNMEHGEVLNDIRLYLPLREFFLSVVQNKELPIMTWKKTVTTKVGSITLITNRKPSSVVSYFANTKDGKRRDFRLFVASTDNPPTSALNPVLWSKKDVKYLNNNTYIAEFNIPSDGWLAFFIEVTFPGVGGSQLEFTTETLIIPNTYPYPDCHNEGCRGSLV